MPAEFDLAPADALQEGQMRAFPASDTQVLLLRREGQYHALGAFCPHYGAPLEKGRIIGDKLVCPWHHACFHVPDGQLCEPPALDSLPSFPVRVEGGRVWVQLPENPPASVDKPDATPSALVGGVPPAPDAAPADSRTFVLVGAGAASQFAAQTLRQEGFGGRIIMLTTEKAAPYDRTKLSKAYLAGKAKPTALPLRETDFYARHHIELLTDTRVTGLDLAARQLLLEGRAPLPYDELLLAPGGIPKRPSLPGSDLRNVFTLRNPTDADAIREAATDARHVVVVGSGFIGMEAASSLVKEGRTLTVVAQGKEPFAKVLGPKIGAMFRQLHQEKGVQFEAEVEVAGLNGYQGTVTGVLLKSGKELPADVVVLGVGVRPATDFLQGTFPLEKDGGLSVDARLQAAEHVYAAGDIAFFPLPAGLGQHRVEHWRVAQQHGAAAARNMLGRQQPFGAVPFFWTQQFGKSLRYVGHATHWDDIIYQGEVEKQDFVALYVQQNRIVAAATMGRDDDMVCLAALFQQGRMPTPEEARSGVQWAELLEKA